MWNAWENTQNSPLQAFKAHKEYEIESLSLGHFMPTRIVTCTWKSKRAQIQLSVPMAKLCALCLPLQPQSVLTKRGILTTSKTRHTQTSDRGTNTCHAHSHIHSYKTPKFIRVSWKSTKQILCYIKNRGYAIFGREVGLPPVLR